MPMTTLQRKLSTAFNRAALTPPWIYLVKQIPYDNANYFYALRPGTMPTTVKLIGPILQAASMYHRERSDDIPIMFSMIQRKVGKILTTILEAPLTDGTTALLTCTSDTSAHQQLRISIVEDDGSRLPTVKFADMDEMMLSMVALVLLPHIIKIDVDNGNGKLSDAISEIGKALDDAATSPWADASEIPELAMESAYFLDAAMSVLKEYMVIDCGNDSSDIPAEMEASYFTAPDAMTGALICENPGANGWTPKYVKASGTAKRFASSRTTVADAKAQFSFFSAHRCWSPQEQALIPCFPDDTPVMPETLRIANRIINTKDDVNPVCNVMWRGVTSFGKSTGVRQLACILNVPLLTLTCHPDMEASEFKSQFVPDSKTEELLVDMNNLRTAGKSASNDRNVPPFFEEAISHYSGLDETGKEALLTAENFYSMAIMDTEYAAEMLLGRTEEIDPSTLCWLYSEVCSAVRESPMKARIAELEAAAPEGSKNSKPEFVHVLSPYIKAMVNGYMVEIQEASRIRDSGVLVSINEFDRPGSVIPLMNGYSAVRHKDAICVITDNVGYSSCRPIDPSVLRRQSMIIDSYELPKDLLLDRVRRNTGVTDNALLERCYSLWDTVKSYCEQNSITEGSVSPMELERFVQAVKYDGMDSINYNLDDCVISKATSSIDDQRDIRTACQTVA